MKWDRPAMVGSWNCTAMWVREADRCKRANARESARAGACAPCRGGVRDFFKTRNKGTRAAGARQ
jgi:hypothetical protein